MQNRVDRARAYTAPCPAQGTDAVAHGHQIGTELAPLNRLSTILAGKVYNFHPLK